MQRLLSLPGGIGRYFFSSPEGIGITAKNRKDQEESIKFNDNGYYRGLDRNIWKVSDYAGTNIVKVR